MSDQEKLLYAIQGFKDVSACLTALAVLSPESMQDALLHYENTCLAIMQVSSTALRKLSPEGYVSDPTNKGVH